MSVVFFVPLVFIALFESQVAHSRSQRISMYFGGEVPEEEGEPRVENPSSDDPNGEISKVEFDELCSNFPQYVPSTLAYGQPLGSGD